VYFLADCASQITETLFDVGRVVVCFVGILGTGSTMLLDKEILQILKLNGTYVTCSIF